MRSISTWTIHHQNTGEISNIELLQDLVFHVTPCGIPTSGSVLSPETFWWKPSWQDSDVLRRGVFKVHVMFRLVLRLPSSLSDSLLKFWWQALKHSGGFGGFLWFELMWEQNSATCRTDVVFRHFNAGKLHIISSSQTKLLLMNWLLTLWLLTYSLISSFISFGCYGDS